MSNPQTDVLGADSGALRANARLYRPDPRLDGLADLYESDRDAWSRLSLRDRDLSYLHYEMRQTYRAAVHAGLVPAGRGPAA
ncbi:MAG: hypothetical protein M3Q22_01680 [Actinomycetota bacterium]|nr:hypothetical protein [Actinomycetota bacterium]